MTPEELEEEKNRANPQNKQELKKSMEAYVDSLVGAQRITISATRVNSHAKGVNLFLMVQSIILLLLNVFTSGPLLGTFIWAGLALWGYFMWQRANKNDKDIDAMINTFEEGLRDVNKKYLGE